MNTSSPSKKKPAGAALGAKTSAYDAPEWVALRGVDFSNMSQEDLIELLRKLLKQKIHGISFSPYIDGQRPGVHISEDQIRERLAIIAPYVKWIRNFSCIEGNEATPRIAKEEFGLKTMVGIELSDDHEENEAQFAGGIEIAKAGHADILAVGNEVLLRGDMSQDDLLDYIRRAKEAVPDVPVTFVDAYFLFEQYPAVADAIDVLSVNCYPFWEKCSAEYSLLYVKEMYRRALRAAKGKRVIISETGWPTQGTPYGSAVPNYGNALQYFINICKWAEEEDLEFFYFSSFDENWKIGAEGDVGAYWGLWDAQGNLKF